MQQIELGNIIIDVEQKDIKNKCLVFNDVQPDRRAYGYKYKDTYYTNNQEKGFIRRTFSFIFLKRNRAMS